MGLPDLGMLGLEELCFFTRTIFRAADLPLVVDADTGFGGTLNVMRAVRELEDAGAAAIQIEDQVQAKKCGHLDDKQLVAAEGIDSAIARAQRYLEAGADAIFPEALTDAEMFQRFAREIHAPLLANMTEFGRTPYFTAREFEQFGFRMVIWPTSALRVAAKAIENLYATFRQEGSAVSLLDRMQTRTELYQTIGYHDYEALDASIAQSILPSNPHRER
jgi:methylisocitrate lyase